MTTGQFGSAAEKLAGSVLLEMEAPVSEAETIPPNLSAIPSDVADEPHVIARLDATNCYSKLAKEVWAVFGWPNRESPFAVELR